MSEEERFKLENELLMTKSKAQMINLYLDKLDQLQQKENIIKEVRELINYYGITPEQNDDTTCRSILKQFLGILDKEVN